ncbi:MAG: 2-C-methyl-D-erythritol 4-phosphate cytidylyltransferase [Bacteroidales bacterium]|nr:2-C-methyl-D-erythritol 4-phosphate cytidylyltransferase [Bacteroidales bacterium]
MKNAAIIVAGGMGKRMNNALPKQFLQLKGKPILFYTMEHFYNYDSNIEIILVLPEPYFALWKELLYQYSFTIPHKLVYGGQTRYHSVKNGLSAIDDAHFIAIHDGVRPFITPAFIAKLFDEAQEFGSSVPVIPVNETVRRITSTESKVLNRNEIFLVQTPQVFKTKWLEKAYEQPYDEFITDDAMLVEKANYSIYFSEGLKNNIKITTPDDLDLAEKLML